MQAADPRFEWFRKRASGFSGQLLWGEPLSKHAYYRIGGPAALIAVPKSLEDLSWLAEGITATGVSFFVLGAGSNLLVSDIGFEGLVVKGSRLNLEMDQVNTSRIRTGGGIAISSLLRRAAQEGWGGLEFLTGVPGSVGGAVYMNAGTHLGETKDRLRKVEAFHLSSQLGLRSFEGRELRYEYRRNLFLPEGVVVWVAEWEVTREDPATVKARIDETLARRKATQPIDYPSCGSVFKNPREHGLHAWQVIEKLGLRGHRIGGAQFSEKHCNFIVNHGDAKAADVRALIELAKSRASRELGVRLEEEVKYLGFKAGAGETVE